ncbi:hypothetical protein AXG93_369s1250 [Marchantia polymorpha subsp. ruderalis]|uniref:Uncharacterized protein n=1 Tax=Marchantia polymorpha subsp. ruderalis TaxID=1480154 RepID=A0A176VTX9_MARPO|nr:hypothetical protein AXG93_369s1250 [Marchantia polymorpha subsp. ruderalis]
MKQSNYGYTLFCAPAFHPLAKYSWILAVLKILKLSMRNSRDPREGTEGADSSMDTESPDTFDTRCPRTPPHGTFEIDIWTSILGPVDELGTTGAGCAALLDTQGLESVIKAVQKLIFILDEPG